MAINKDVENEYGAEFNYHKLREVRIINDDKVGIQLSMTVYSWINKEARIARKVPCVRRCIINGADFAMTPFYALLKTKFPEFTDGIDDFDNDFKGNPAASAPVFFEQTADGKTFDTWQEAKSTKENPDGGNE